MSLPVVGTGDILPGLYNYRISYNYTCLDDTGRSKCPENSTCTDIELVVEIVGRFNHVYPQCMHAYLPRD